MDPDSEKQQRQQRLSARQARAMTRAIDMVSEEFIENFSQTGIDEGPEQPERLSPVRQALADREARERQETAAKSNESEFRGFAALMGGAKRKATGAFSRHLAFDQEPMPPSPSRSPHDAAIELSPENIPASPPVGTPASTPASSPVNTPEESLIKVRNTVGKKRGLYTSCMQRPDTAKMEEWAAKAAQDKDVAEKHQLEAVRKPARTKSLITKQASCSFEESGNTCPIAFAFGKIIAAVKKLFGK